MAEEKKAEKTVEKAKSEAYKNFEKLIEAYKKENPVKYELKKKALEAQLAAL